MRCTRSTARLSPRSPGRDEGPRDQGGRTHGVALEIMLQTRQLARVILPKARAGDRKAVALMRDIVKRMHRMGLSGPSLVALLTEEV